MTRDNTDGAPLSLIQAWHEFSLEPRHPKSVALMIRHKALVLGAGWVTLLVFTLVMCVVEEAKLGNSWWVIGAVCLCWFSYYVFGQRKALERMRIGTEMVWASDPDRALEVLRGSTRFIEVMESREREDKNDDTKGPALFFALMAVFGLVPYVVAEWIWRELPSALTAFGRTLWAGYPMELTGLLLGLAGLVGVVSLLVSAFLFMLTAPVVLSRRQEDIEIKQLKAIAPEIFHGDVLGALSLDQNELHGALELTDSVEQNN